MATDRNITESARDVPVMAEADVLVLGGGPAGFAAALAAARNGTDVLLLERFAFLGGCLTAVRPGLLLQKPEFIGGIYQEVADWMARHDAMWRIADEDLWTDQPPMPAEAMYSYDPEALKYVLNSLCRREGVRLLLHSWFAAPVMRDDQPAGAFFESKSGRGAILAKIVIDCTGDADFVFRAGGRCTSAEQPIRVTKTMRVGNVKAGTGSVKQFDGQVRNIFAYSTGPIDGTDVRDLTRAESDAIEHIYPAAEKLREQPGFEDSYLLATGDVIGVRETRQIAGAATLRDADVIEGRRFADGIARGNYPTDLHPPQGEVVQPIPFIRPRSGWYEIPYGVMVPESLDNTLAAGRCISAERDAMSSMRVSPICMTIGQAAGTAASVCVREGTQPGEIDGASVRTMLERQGVRF